MANKHEMVTIVLAVLVVSLAGFVFYQNFSEPEITGNVIQETISQGEFNFLKNQFQDLSERLKLIEDLDVEKDELIVGGGYEAFYGGGRNETCVSWGVAYCERRELNCPSEYKKFLIEIDEDKINWDERKEQFICILKDSLKVETKNYD